MAKMTYDANNWFMTIDFLKVVKEKLMHEQKEDEIEIYAFEFLLSTGRSGFHLQSTEYGHNFNAAPGIKSKPNRTVNISVINDGENNTSPDWYEVYFGNESHYLRDEDKILSEMVEEVVYIDIDTASQQVMEWLLYGRRNYAFGLINKPIGVVNEDFGSDTEE